MLCRNNPGIICQQEGVRGNTQHHPDPSHMEPGTGLSCAHALHRVRWRTYERGSLTFSSSCEKLCNYYHWKEWKNKLYEMDWCPYIKETFNGFGNAIKYLGHYTHKIAVSNSRILSVSDDTITFSARGKKPGDPKRLISLEHTEFIRRYLMHVLPSGFQKIRYYGVLNNRYKTRNLKLIFKLQGHQRFKAKYINLSMAELLKAVWNLDIHVCPECGCYSMQYIGRTYGTS